MNFFSELIRILQDPKLQSKENEETHFEALEELSEVFGWSGFVDAALRLLEDKSYSGHWVDLLVVIYEMVCEEIELPQDRLIASLLRCQKSKKALDENTVWSIIMKLKGLDYHSNYDPLSDLEILREYNQVRFE